MPAFVVLVNPLSSFTALLSHFTSLIAAVNGNARIYVSIHALKPNKVTLASFWLGSRENFINTITLETLQSIMPVLHFLKPAFQCQPARRSIWTWLISFCSRQQCTDLQTFVPNTEQSCFFFFIPAPSLTCLKRCQAIFFFFPFFIRFNKFLYMRRHLTIQVESLLVWKHRSRIVYVPPNSLRSAGILFHRNLDRFSFCKLKKSRCSMHYSLCHSCLWMQLNWMWGKNYRFCLHT